MNEKKSIKKKILHWLFLVLIACVLALAVLFVLMLPIIKGDVYYDENGRHTKEETTHNVPKMSKNMDHEPPTSILVELTNEDIFEKGYYEYYFDVFSSGYVQISSKNAPESGIEWKVYISDIELSEEEIYELEGTEPVAINNGETEAERGQWFYILCNINSQTSEAPSNSMFGMTSMRSYA